MGLKISGPVLPGRLLVDAVPVFFEMSARFVLLRRITDCQFPYR